VVAAGPARAPARGTVLLVLPRFVVTNAGMSDTGSKPNRPVEWDERSPELFAPDLLLACQHADRVRPGRDALSPERRLLIAVLEDAVHVYRTQAGAVLPRQRALFADAEAWIESDDRSWIFSFESICDHLGLDPEYLRRGLRAHRARTRGVALRATAVSIPGGPASADAGVGLPVARSA